MDLKQLEELMGAMERHRLTKISIKEKSGYEVVLEKNEPRLEASSYVRSEAQPMSEMVRVSTPSSESMHVSAPQKHEEKPGTFVKSPMVGTFYRSPSPQDPVFVKVGDHVKENTVLCIIEAMKVMNEVKAQKTGKIAEILVENMQPVEFGTKLFRIE